MACYSFLQYATEACKKYKLDWTKIPKQTLEWMEDRWTYDVTPTNMEEFGRFMDGHCLIGYFDKERVHAIETVWKHATADVGTLETPRLYFSHEFNDGLFCLEFGSQVALWQCYLDPQEYRETAGISDECEDDYFALRKFIREKLIEMTEEYFRLYTYRTDVVKIPWVNLKWQRKVLAVYAWD